ncbi:MAG: hypothetical protein N2Z22_08045 [Turneriella sp.]|nr:hypothetical protein [Turneriella sp.]
MNRIPEIPLPKNFLRVLNEEPVTKEDLERLRKSMQQTIDQLQQELRRERELTEKLKKSAEVLQEILNAPDFRSLSLSQRAALTELTQERAAAPTVDEPPVEYVEVQEIELTDAQVSALEKLTATQKKKEED